MIPFSQEIAELAEFIAEENISRGSVNLDKIASREGIYVCPGHYNNCFTGMLRHVNGEFQIFLNLDKLSSLKYARSRFTYGHELGHYFIDKHRRMLKAGYSLSYDKDLTYFTNNPVEAEANHFATNLLMPKQRFIADIAQHEFGVEAIRALSKKYKTSYTATAIQYSNLSNYPCSLLFWNKDREFRRKNYSGSMYSMVRQFSQNFSLNDKIKSEIFEEFDSPFNFNDMSSVTTSLANFYPDVTVNGPVDMPLKVETITLQSYGYISLVFINQ
jgi:Zn-dependent peptidase ImmA (M78 family)